MKYYIIIATIICCLGLFTLLIGGKAIETSAMEASTAGVTFSAETPAPSSAASTVETEIYAFWLQKHDASPENAEEMEAKCTQVAELCGNLFLNAETETSIYFPNETTLVQESVDSIEATLIDAGYPVVDSDAKYPSYLANAESIQGFFNAAERGESVRQDIIYVSEYGMLQIYTLCYGEGDPYCIHGSVMFNEDGTLDIADPQESPLLSCGLTYNGYLYYQFQPLNNHGEAISWLLTSPAETSLYDLCEKYILPIGYQSNNLFLVDWDSSDYGYLSFNDLLEYLYYAQHGEYMSTSDLAFYTDTAISSIPADMFESVILPFFDVPLDDFRAFALYDSATDTYPWERAGCMNLTYFPLVQPTVSACRENGDKTITITVDVLCFDLQAFPLFTHEVTVRPNDDGSFQYLSNTVTYKSGIDFPNTNPRLVAQRPSD